MESRSFLKSWGAEFVAADTVRFRVWASGQESITLRLSGKEFKMNPAGEGCFRYRYLPWYGISLRSG